MEQDRIELLLENILSKVELPFLKGITCSTQKLIAVAAELESKIKARSGSSIA